MCFNLLRDKFFFTTYFAQQAAHIVITLTFNPWTFFLVLIRRDGEFWDAFYRGWSYFSLGNFGRVIAGIVVRALGRAGSGMAMGGFGSIWSTRFGNLTSWWCAEHYR